MAALQFFLTGEEAKGEDGDDSSSDEEVKLVVLFTWRRLQLCGRGGIHLFS